MARQPGTTSRKSHRLARINGLAQGHFVKSIERLAHLTNNCPPSVDT